ncbi:hypothetical protein DQ04_06241050 [Trypanosoma grayi]|uniref:hypothetical protein n=1 Tax=Trypanosoma grayi TaxID=71804 RepID=UPI0004F45310|nr:hypothetical protein DQ04_06241050 [Trypanosoma grayi]KEG08894.1 hypothetical protein DQ04_06241050 [Trypanosoma grayi]
MTELARPWENAPESPPGSPVTPGAGLLVPQSPATGVGAAATSTSITTTKPTTMTSVQAQQNAVDNPQQATSANNTADTSNRYGSGYASSYGSGLGYGGLGTGGMYGGLGMGGMYGGLGMGGMYGGLGMGGMYGGLGMGGMGMYGMGMGMSEDFQRSQMTFMLVGRLLEMCGMFAGVIQTTFGSALQFMGNYIGMSQQYNQLKSGMYMDESGKWVQAPKRISADRNASHASRRQKLIKKKQKGSAWIALLRRLGFLLLAILLVRKFTSWSAARQLAKVQRCMPSQV